MLSARRWATCVPHFMSSKHHTTLAFFSLIFLVNTAHSAALSLDDVITMALKNNPQLMHEQTLLNQSHHAYKNTVESHQPQWSINGSRTTRHSEQDDTQLGLSMAWPLHNGDNLQASIESGGRSRITYKHAFLKGSGFTLNNIQTQNQLDQWNEQKDRYQDAQSQTIVGIKKAFRQLAFLIQERILQEDTHRFIQEEWEKSKKLYENKKYSKQEYLEQKMHFLKSKQHLNEIKHQERHARIALSELIHQSPDSIEIDSKMTIHPPSYFPSLESTWASWSTNNHSAKSSQRQLMHLEREVLLKKNDLLWDASISLNARSNKKHDVTLAFDIPLDFRAERRALHDAKDAVHIQKISQEQQLNHAKHQLEHLHQTLEDLYQRVSLHEKDFELAEMQLNIEEIHKKHNNLSIHEYHHAINQFKETAHLLFSTKMNYLNASDDYLLFINRIPPPSGARS